MNVFLKFTGMMIGLSSVVVIAGTAFPALNEPLPPVAPAVTPAHDIVGDNSSIESWETNGQAIACDRLEDIEKFIDFAGAQDKAAIDRYFVPLLVRKDCIVIAKGTKVFISNVSIFGSTVRVRVRGETDYHYVPRDVLEMIRG
jgi:hypothetical protein